MTHQCASALHRHKWHCSCPMAHTGNGPYLSSNRNRYTLCSPEGSQLCRHTVTWVTSHTAPGSCGKHPAEQEVKVRYSSSIISEVCPFAAATLPPCQRPFNITTYKITTECMLAQAHSSVQSMRLVMLPTAAAVYGHLDFLMSICL